MREAVTRRKSKALIWVACWAVFLAGSEVEELLLKTAAEVTQIANINPFDESLEADAFVRRQEEIQLVKVTEIGRCYGTFLAQLQALGEDVDRFREFIDAEIRSTVSIAFDQPEGFEALEKWQEAFSQAADAAFVAGGSEEERHQ